MNIRYRQTSSQDLESKAHYRENCRTGRLSIEIAATVEELQTCWRIVYSQYRASGYLPERASQFHITPHGLLPDSIVLLAKMNETPVGTQTYILDSDAGLPCDELVASTLAEFRRRGKVLCEVSGDAVTDEGRASHAVMELFRTGWNLARFHLGVTDFVIVINPRHRFFFEKVLLFRPLCGKRRYGKYNSAPGVAMHLDLHQAESLYFERYSHREGNRNLYRYFVEEKSMEINRLLVCQLLRRRHLLTHDTVTSIIQANSDLLPKDLSAVGAVWAHSELHGLRPTPLAAVQDAGVGIERMRTH